MTSALHAIEIIPQGYRHSTSFSESEGSAVIHVDFSLTPPPICLNSLVDFLDEFEASPEIAQHIPAARMELAQEMSQGAPLNLRTLRLQRGLSQADLAIALGTSQAAISSLEGRSRKPNEDTIRGLRDALNVDFNTLMDALANG